MKTIQLLLCLAVLSASGQSTKFTESIPVEGQTKLNLEFAFADEIVFKVWDKKEVLVEAEVEINNGKYNDIFSMHSRTSESAVYVEMDEDLWDKVDRKNDWDCNWRSRMDYTVYLPRTLEVEANTISGNYEVDYFGSPLNLKTISGAIDVTISAKRDLDFKAKTISGEIFTDMEIQFPYGKAGLRQIVGQKVRGRVGDGGEESELETISGNIYLRKG